MPVTLSREIHIHEITGLNEVGAVSYVSGYLRGFQKEGPKVIVLIGGPASGKSTFVADLALKLGHTTILTTDNYVKGDRNWRRTNIENQGKDPVKKYDPEFLQEQVLQIAALQEGEEVGVPVYDEVSGIAISKDPEEKPDTRAYSNKVRGRQDFIIVEGDFMFLPLSSIDRLLYLDVDDSVREENRVHRDTQKRKEDADPVESEKKTRENFSSRQRTQFIPHTSKQKGIADLVIKVHATPLQEPTPVTKYHYMYDLIEQRQS